MKNSLILFIFLIVYVQTQLKLSNKAMRGNNQYAFTDSSYLVYKIDSVNSYYIIYAKKDGGRYKIVSKKENIDKCKCIKINENYNFLLHSGLSSKVRIGNLSFSPNETKEVTCFAYDKTTTICLEGDTIKDLYYADNIKGLCFVNNVRHK